MLNESIFVLTLIVAIIIIIEAIIKSIKWADRKDEDHDYNEFLKDPLKNLTFFIPIKKKYKIKYCKQDDKEHSLKQIEMPPNFNDVIFLMWTPKENFETDEIYYGFESNKSKKKPKIIDYKNPFVKKSNLPPPYFYIDWWDDYHIVKEKRYFKHEVYVTGLEVETYDKGTYDLYIKFPIMCEKYKNIKERRQKKVTIKKLQIVVK